MSATLIRRFAAPSPALREKEAGTSAPLSRRAGEGGPDPERSEGEGPGEGPRASFSRWAGEGARRADEGLPSKDYS